MIPCPLAPWAGWSNTLVRKDRGGLGSPDGDRSVGLGLRSSRTAKFFPDCEVLPAGLAAARASVRFAAVLVAAAEVLAGRPRQNSRQHDSHSGMIDVHLPGRSLCRPIQEGPIPSKLAKPCCDCACLPSVLATPCLATDGTSRCRPARSRCPTRRPWYSRGGRKPGARYASCVVPGRSHLSLAASDRACRHIVFICVVYTDTHVVEGVHCLGCRELVRV